MKKTISDKGSEQTINNYGLAWKTNRRCWK